MESQFSLELTRQLLIKTQSEEVQEAEAALKRWKTHPQFFSNLYFIMTNLQQEQWVKTTAASYLNSIFSESANEENCQQFFEALAKVLMEPSIKQMDKRIFEKSIIKVIEESTEQNKQKWLTVIIECLKDIKHFDTAYLVIACLAVADIPQDIVLALIKQTYEQILTSLAVSIQNANLLNEMIKMWIVVLDKLKAESPDRQIIKRMIGSPCLFNLINEIYQLQASENNIVCYREGMGELNFLKYEAAQVNKRMLDFEIQCLDEAFVPILDFTKRNLPKFANTLMAMAARKRKIQDLNCEDLTTTLLSVIRLYCSIKPDDFKPEDVIALQNHILFPFLEIDDSERLEFEESPENFNALAQDCCDKQTFEILKTEAAKLLQKFGDKVEGSLKYSINRAIESLKVKLGYVQTYFDQNLPLLEVQTSFLVLSIFSYGISTYPDELNIIRTILCDPRTQALPPLELARIFTFLAYNYSDVFKNPLEGESWLVFILNYSAHPTTMFCAFDCFSNIVEDYFNESLMDKLTDQISKGGLSIVWEIVSKLLERHYAQISGEGIGTLINKVFVRISKQIELLENNERKDTLDLINCLRTFINILKEMRKEEKGNLVASTKKDYIVGKIWPILDFYQPAEKYDIEDEVVKVTIEMINTMDNVVSGLSPYLKQYITAYRTNQYSEKVYLKLFNQYLFKADFQNNMNDIILILIALKEGLLNSLGKLIDKDGKVKSLPHLRLSLSNTMLVVQNAIAVYGTSLLASSNLEFFHEISSICVRILPKQQEEIEKSASGRIIQSRAFNTLFLCHMHIKIQSIYEYLAMMRTQKAYHGYDTIVLALCICKQVFNETDISAIVALLSGVIKIAHLSAEKEEIIEKNKKKKNQKLKVSTHLRTLQDFDKLISSLDSPFKKSKDLSEIFSQMFCDMKHSNIELYNTILASLPSEDLDGFKTYVNFEQLEKKKRVFVKVVGVKMSSDPVQPLKVAESSQMKDSDEEESGLKRQRMKVKVEGKSKKVIKMERKKHHRQDI